MPIYAYRCAECGHAKDVLQKLSDAPLAICPACGAPRFEKQVTAAGFQLKGSGWYATDFKNGSTATDKKPAAAEADAAAKTDAPGGAAAPTSAPAPSTASTTPTPAPAAAAAAPAATTPAASSS
jgi:putative FmdB family regulatory protein